MWSGTLVPVSTVSESGVAVNCEARGGDIIFICLILLDLFYGETIGKENKQEEDLLSSK